MRRPQLRHVLDEHEFREVVVDGGLRQVGAGGDVPAITERRPAEPLVLGSGPAPGRAPVAPAINRRCDAGEVSRVHAVGNEARRPVVDSHRHQPVCHPDILAHDCSADIAHLPFTLNE